MKNPTWFYKIIATTSLLVVFLALVGEIFFPSSNTNTWLIVMLGSGIYLGVKFAEKLSIYFSVIHRQKKTKNSYASVPSSPSFLFFLILAILLLGQC